MPFLIDSAGASHLLDRCLPADRHVAQQRFRSCPAGVHSCEAVQANALAMGQDFERLTTSLCLPCNIVPCHLIFPAETLLTLLQGQTFSSNMLAGEILTLKVFPSQKLFLLTNSLTAFTSLAHLP